MSKTTVNLGDEVRCTVTGFQGVVTSITEYLNGCRRVGIQPPVGKDKEKLPDAFVIDEPQLVIVKAKKVPTGPRDTGGPTSRITASRASR